MLLKFGPQRAPAQSNARDRAKHYDDAIVSCHANLRDLEKRGAAKGPRELAMSALEGAGLDVAEQVRIDAEIATVRDTLEGLLRLRAELEPELWLVEQDELQAAYDAEMAQFAKMREQRRDLELQIEQLDKQLRRAGFSGPNGPRGRLDALQAKLDAFNADHVASLKEQIARIRRRLLSGVRA